MKTKTAGLRSCLSSLVSGARCVAPAPTATPSVQPGFGEEGEKEVQGLRVPVLPVPAWPDGARQGGRVRCGREHPSRLGLRVSHRLLLTQGPWRPEPPPPGTSHVAHAQVSSWLKRVLWPQLAGKEVQSSHVVECRRCLPPPRPATSPPRPCFSPLLAMPWPVSTPTGHAAALSLHAPDRSP